MVDVDDGVAVDVLVGVNVFVAVGDAVIVGIDEAMNVGVSVTAGNFLETEEEIKYSGSARYSLEIHPSA